MPDTTITTLNTRLLNLINTGVDSATAQPISPGVTNKNAPGGMEYAHSLYPEEFEAYAIALELVNGDNFTEEFFSFPIMPKQYSESRGTNTSIEKTMAGVVITSNPTFVPFDIHINGNFGRRFKRINTDIPNGQPGTASNGNLPVTVQNVFSSDYKTGYGCYKIMERIILKSQKQDSNYKPYKLFIYNLSLNSNYMVEALVLSPSQNRDTNNMIWEYSLHLKAVAPASSVSKTYKSSLTLLSDYSRLTREAVFQSDEIQQYQQDRLIQDKKVSKVQQIITRQAIGRAYGLFNNSQKSAIQALIELTDDPRDIGDFAVNVGEGILNRFPR